MKKFWQWIVDLFKSLFGKKEEVIVVEGESGETIPVNEPDIVDVEENNEEPQGETDPVEIFTGKVSNMKILIDCGHGNNTAGKRSPYSMNKVEPAIEFYEYKWNREIGKTIVDDLVAKGYDAELVVTEENDISLSERARRVNAICEKVGASNVIMISIHANAAGNATKWMTAKGWSAFTTKGTTKSDKLAEFLYDEAEKNFEGRKIRKDMSDGDRDWEENFTVIYKTMCPSVLTENFFYDNVDDVEYILSDEGRAAVVKTHVDGIINYINSL